MALHEYRVILFDLGGVLVEVDGVAAFQRLLAQPLSADDVWHRWLTAPRGSAASNPGVVCQKLLPPAASKNGVCRSQQQRFWKIFAAGQNVSGPALRNFSLVVSFKEDHFPRRQRPAWINGRPDETYTRVKSEWKYLYRHQVKYFNSSSRQGQLPSHRPHTKIGDRAEKGPGGHQEKGNLKYLSLA